ncbi:MarR family winged helix-turn-helix transcriptional regulator [Undibacterium danionis]|uniref:MarR family winged helix-turn-helix transcriptional regulator n=1 Tax=Undibacterium danionis TaxID=1812100 RepID=A0ABV6IEL4_9BURK
MQSFEKISSKRVRSLGFTDSQFDIIATLGNTPGMTCKELGEKTLITKGTLTGVLDRLEQKGLIQRERGEDRRQLFVKLTPEGELQFANAFPEVVKQGREIFSEYQLEDYDALEAQLLKLKLTLTRAS